MKDRPILFSGEMIRALLREDKPKTQTRRVLLPQPDLGLDDIDRYHHIEVGLYHPSLIDKNGELFPGPEIFGAYTNDGEWGWKCPYGRTGDRLWIKETHYRFGHWEVTGFIDSGRPKWTFIPETKEVLFWENPPAEIKKGRREHGWFKRPSIFMPRWASRITLEITGIRAERVQEISEADAIAEGIEKTTWEFSCTPFKDYIHPEIPNGGHAYAPASYKSLWDSINTKRGYSWESNPWVWVIEFKRMKP